MNQQDMFYDAKWVSADTEDESISPVIRRSFEVRNGESARIRLIGLGTFELYLNGARVSEDRFLPLASEYENINCPRGEELNYRIYCTEYDLTPYLREGENTLAVLLGFGWYTGIYLWGKWQKKYGEKKLIYSISLEDKTGAVRRIDSDGSEKWSGSFVVGGHLHAGESHDYRGWDNACLGSDFDDSDFGRVKFSAPVESDYCFTDCPADTVGELLVPTVVYKTENYTVYDAGKNISGYPVLVSEGESGSEIKVLFSEILDEEGRELSPTHMHSQSATYITNGKGQELYPRFTWFGFRYFKVEGAASVKTVAVVHSNVKVDSSFETDNETLNWIYNTFVQTQLNNMHRGIPSDCPHIERLGYTGDGQLVCRSALHTFDGEAFYRKWIADIYDCQDRKTGHVQYTAPYILAGGGPGGWGCAIVTVPYEFYKYYGDETVLRTMYPGMLKYLDFLEAHSEYGLVTSDIPGAWCLGDWCTPPDQSNIPQPFVNTCFYVSSMQKVIEISKILGKSEETEYLYERIENCKRAIDRCYFNDSRIDGTYIANLCGASAFALNIGLGSELTKDKLIKYYDRIGYYDTGIFATELVTRKLFELGRADVAFKLLVADEPTGFGRWKKNGETALPEYWGPARSHDHPMFGAVVATFFEYILGIRQAEDSVRYDRIIISPAVIPALSYARGHITTPHGRIAVEYRRTGEKTEYRFDIPSGVSATLRLDGLEPATLCEGVNTVSV